MSVAETWVETTPVDGLRGRTLAPMRPHQWPGWASAQSVAVMPGEAATPDVLRHEEARQAIIALVYRFAAYGLSWIGGAEPAKITAITRQVSEAFLHALPAGKAFPKISPDGEGGLMMVWEHGGEQFLLTVDDLRLHGVKAAGTSRAEYMDDVPFELAQDIPQRILDCIPAR